MCYLVYYINDSTYEILSNFLKFCKYCSKVVQTLLTIFRSFLRKI